jgi:hypothetical protein
MTYRIYRTNGTDRTWFSVGGDLSSVALAKEDPGVSSQQRRRGKPPLPGYWLLTWPIRPVE